MATQKKVDVVTVGAGWTAAILAWKLTEVGLRVVSLEQGPSRWTDPDFKHDHDPLRFHARHAMMVDLGRETWSWRPNPKLPSLPMRQYGSFNPGQGVGGAAIHWTAQLWRFSPDDFRYRSHHIEKYGEDKLPAGNRIQDWPISYDELEPYYDEFEYDIGASGQAGNINGNIIEGGNPFEGPRSRPYPLPPMPPNIPSVMFADVARNLGYHPFPYPSGITSRAYRDRFGNYRSGCLLCGFCTRYGCEVDAKSSPQTTHLPPALKTGRYEIRTGCKVIRVEQDADGLATGLTYIDPNGEEQFQPAEVVVLSGFTLTNVRMLLVSRGGAHPNGIGNDHGLVARTTPTSSSSRPSMATSKAAASTCTWATAPPAPRCTISMATTSTTAASTSSVGQWSSVPWASATPLPRPAFLPLGAAKIAQKVGSGLERRDPAGVEQLCRHRPGRRKPALRGSVPGPRPEVQGQGWPAAAAIDL